MSPTRPRRHGLDQYRAEGVPVKAAAFTNFSRDHLDYHSDMDAYFAAKMRLFDEVVAADGTAVVWTGDAKSAEVIEHAKQRGLKLITVGPGAETIELVSRQSTPLGQQLLLRHEGKEHKLGLPLIGAYQMNNVLTAAGLVLATGGDWATTLSGMGRVSPVRGRLERAVISRAGAPVYVDYAHTPDAVEAAIEALRPHVEGPADHRARRGRRPRPGQAAGNGRGGGAAERRGHRHRRQSAQRGSGGDPHALCLLARRARSRSATGAQRSPRRSPWPRRATLCWWPARATNRGRSSETRCFHSTM